MNEQIIERYHTLRNYKRTNKQGNIITHSIATNCTSTQFCDTMPLHALTRAVHGLYQEDTVQNCPKKHSYVVISSRITE